MKNYNFVRFYFGKERCHLQSEVKRNYVMAPKMAPKMIPKNKLLTSSTISVSSLNKIREFTHHEQTPP